MCRASESRSQVPRLRGAASASRCVPQQHRAQPLRQMPQDRLALRPSSCVLGRKVAREAQGPLHQRTAQATPDQAQLRVLLQKNRVTRVLVLQAPRRRARERRRHARHELRVHQRRRQPPKERDERGIRHGPSRLSLVRLQGPPALQLQPCSPLGRALAPAAMEPIERVDQTLRLLPVRRGLRLRGHQRRRPPFLRRKGEQVGEHGLHARWRPVQVQSRTRCELAAKQPPSGRAPPAARRAQGHARVGVHPR